MEEEKRKRKGKPDFLPLLHSLQISFSLHPRSLGHFLPEIFVSPAGAECAKSVKPRPSHVPSCRVQGDPCHFIRAQTLVNMTPGAPLSTSILWVLAQISPCKQPLLHNPRWKLRKPATCRGGDGNGVDASLYNAQRRNQAGARSERASYDHHPQT